MYNLYLERIYGFMDFMNEMKKTLNDEKTLTENGAVGYRTTGKELLDLNFAVTSLRSASDVEIVEKFTKAFFEDKELAVKWLVFCRDVREGLGERRLFRVIFKYLGNTYPDIAKMLIPYIEEYARFDDLWVLLDTQCRDEVIKYCIDKLNQDIGIIKKQGEYDELQFISRK